LVEKKGEPGDVKIFSKSNDFTKALVGLVEKETKYYSYQVYVFDMKGEILN